ncbi:sigma-w pathway protein ysdB [Litchfieldia salsa]|uniref:Sigma-w pathway protein ysdB n=1 Tax=Litchfieldia salsa TaxID=930152 RepID=A0A1H0P053_9BACI|nr:hypothetical protein SAMN05216565_10195 [Litchfieldia salsa]
MIVILLRLLLFAAIFFIIFTIIKYLLSPRRKLELAHEQKKTYFLDDQKNVRKNFLLTYKGVLFEGEKYLGTTDRAFDVISIFVWTKNTSELKGLTYDDFNVIERKIKSAYPNAKIDWKSPIKEFLIKKQR